MSAKERRVPLSFDDLEVTLYRSATDWALENIMGRWAGEYFLKIALIQWSPTFSPPSASLGGGACFLLAHGLPAAATAAATWGLEGEC